VFYKVLAFVVFSLLNSSDGYSQGGAVSLKDSFSKYPSKQILSRLPVLPDFKGRDKSYRRYRTRIRSGIEEGANFGGHYSIVEIGCGTSCRFAFVVDLRTGEVGSFPYGGEEQWQMKLIYSYDSRFLRVRWKGDWDNTMCTEKDLLIDHLDWTILDQRLVPLQDGFCDYD
jgi:hypothetical protein